MLRKYLLLIVGLLVLKCMPYQEAIAEPQVKSRWYLDLVGVNSAIGIPDGNVQKEIPDLYFSKFLWFIGPVGVGTMLFERNSLRGVICVKVEYNNCVVHTLMRVSELSSFLPVILSLTPWSTRVGRTQLISYGYFKGSLWAQTNCTGGFRPSSYFDAGIGLTINSMKFLPIEVRIGMLQSKYLLDFYGEQASASLTCHYASIGLSFRYWD